MIERSMKIGPRIRLLVPGVDGFHAVSGFAFPVCPQTAMKSEDLHMISPRSSLGCNLFAGGHRPRWMAESVEGIASWL